MAKLNKLYVAFLFLSFVGASVSQAYPIWVKIENPRAHTLYIENDREGIRFEIRSGTSKEFKIAGSQNDWRVRYRSGVLGAANQYVLDKELNHFIEGSCKDCMGDNWKKSTVKYCLLRLEEIPGIAYSEYTLTVVEIRDLNIEYASEGCALNANEVLLKVVPIAKNFNLMGAEQLAQAMCLYRGKRGSKG